MPRVGSRLIYFVLLGVAICFAVFPTYAQQQPQLPINGNGLIEYCSHVVDGLDNPPSQLAPAGTGVLESGMQFADNMFKQGWCVGQIQATREMIIFMQAQMVTAVVVASGHAPPSVEEMKHLISNSPDMTCIPNEVGVGQLARVLVRWLRVNPGRLHEMSSTLTLAAFHDSFPCQSETTKQPNPK